MATFDSLRTHAADTVAANHKAFEKQQNSEQKTVQARANLAALLEERRTVFGALGRVAAFFHDPEDEKKAEAGHRGRRSVALPAGTIDLDTPAGPAQRKLYVVTRNAYTAPRAASFHVRDIPERIPSEVAVDFFVGGTAADVSSGLLDKSKVEPITLKQRSAYRIGDTYAGIQGQRVAPTETYAWAAAANPDFTEGDAEDESTLELVNPKTATLKQAEQLIPAVQAELTDMTHTTELVFRAMGDEFEDYRDFYLALHKGPFPDIDVS